MPIRSRSNWNLEVLVFEERGKPEYPGKNLSEQGGEPTSKINPHMASTPGVEPGPHWWEASALTTAPSLAPPNIYNVPNCFDVLKYLL